MSHQDRAFAVIAADRLTHSGEYPTQGIFFRQRGSQWVVWIDAVYFQRRLVNVGALEWLHVVAEGFATQQASVFLDFDQHRSNLQQGIGLAVKAAGLDIDHDRQEAPKSPRHRQQFGVVSR